MRNLEVCFTPSNFDAFNTDKNKVVVIVDIFRASSAICNAFHHGIKSIIPVATVDEAKKYKNKGYMVAAERNGKVIEFADFGNSPFNFTENNIQGKKVVYTTTNGTKAILKAKDCRKVFVGSFLNLSELAKAIKAINLDVLILCAGWKERFNIEDTLFAGALTEKLLNDENYSTNCDAVLCAMELWNSAKNDLKAYIRKAASYERMKRLGIDESIDYCLTSDVTNIIPEFKRGQIMLAEH